MMKFNDHLSSDSLSTDPRLILSVAGHTIIDTFIQVRKGSLGNRIN